MVTKLLCKQVISVLWILRTFPGKTICYLQVWQHLILHQTSWAKNVLQPFKSVSFTFLYYPIFLFIFFILLIFSQTDLLFPLQLLQNNQLCIANSWHIMWWYRWPWSWAAKFSRTLARKGSKGRLEIGLQCMGQNFSSVSSSPKLHKGSTHSWPNSHHLWIKIEAVSIKVPFEIKKKNSGV